MDNEIADLIKQNVNPILSEFLDGFIIAGVKAGTERKVVCIKMPPPKEAEGYEDPDMYADDGTPLVSPLHDFMPIIEGVEEWANITFDLS